MALHSSRFNHLVGEPAERARRHVVWALKTGNQHAVDAFEFSKYSDGHTFGTNRWRFCVGALKDADRLAEHLPEAQPLRVQSTFMLAVGGAVIYPVCYADDATSDVRDMKVRTSQIRQEMFAAYGQLAPQVQIALRIREGVEGIEWVLDDLDESSDGLPDQPKMLLLAYASNRAGGLLNCYIGEATLDASGAVSWNWLESLPVADDEGGSGGLTAVSPTAPTGPVFGAGKEPDLNLEDAESAAHESDDH
ncbi:hypothetical protein P3T35_000307 [Kitasatospora sp. GP30]|uniref:hypothetical protein n=1 Tax=Kitasatospora sp. GP30 TaxID=3035084 RepID=UPI000C70496B|nr:hypothetical protein [Kitasatospora sp. GP30]MDH6138330.1 hypothetical protein [Kitasatospora sp. GP30]